jgi:cytochrome c553
MSPVRSLIAFALALPVAAATAVAQDAPSPAPSVQKPARVADLRKVEPVHGDAQAGVAKAAVCGACHGPTGIGIAPNFPNLAGQSATYLYLQLKAYKEGRRSDPVMTGQAATLADEDMRNIAAHYAALAPKAATPAAANDRGALLYHGGDPAVGAPPCQACHGPDGHGPRPVWSASPQPAWASYPSVGGQSAMYVAKQLTDFKSGARGGSSNGLVMHGVAQNLSDADIQALAAYISTL